MSNAEKFISTFNKIAKYLGELYGAEKYIDFMTLVRDLSKSNNVICSYKDDLKEYAELRNAIVHQRRDKIIAEPHEETVQHLQKIYENLKNPPTSLTIASRPVYFCKVDDLISEVVTEMTKKVYTHVPVYEKNKFIGVFSESSITKWLGDSAESDGFLLEQTRIGELKKYLDQLDDEFNCYKFISRTTDVFNIQDAFLSLVSQHKRLGAVFITERGKEDEKILGIITAWDLPKIKEFLK